MEGPNAPDPTAWGLHGGLHKHCPHARCAMHVHSVYATVLACLADSRLPPVDQTSAMFFNRIAIDDSYGGLAFEEEGARCAQLLDDPKKKVLYRINNDPKQRLAPLVPRRLMDKMILRMLGGQRT